MIEQRSVPSGDEEEKARVRELQAGSEEAFDWLIGHRSYANCFLVASCPLGSDGLGPSYPPTVIEESAWNWD